MDDLYKTGIRPLIDKFLEEKEKDQKYPNYWRASSAGYCHRYIIMKRLGLPPVPEIQDAAARQTRVYEAGHIFHEWMHKVLAGVGASLSAEVELKDDKLNVVGHYDELVDVKDHLILYDYKTANSMAFDYAKNEMNTSWRTQLGTYLYMLRDTGTKVNEGRVLQLEKDTLRMREFQMFYDDALEAEVLTYWTELEKKWQHYQKTEQLPLCQCQMIDDGWFGRRSKKGKVYNDYFYRDEPCSQAWYDLNKGGDE